MKIYNNIEILQVNFTGNTDKVYFPQNSKVAGRKIDEIAFYFAPAETSIITSPLDGTVLLDEVDAAKIYADIVNDDKEILQHNIPITANSLLNNNVIPVNDVIDLELCAVRYAGDIEDIAGKSLLIYVFYDTVDMADDINSTLQSVTIQVPINSADDIQLSEYIDDYILSSGKTVKAIETLSYGVPFYLDVQDFGGRSFRYLPWQRMLKPRNDYGVSYKNPIMLSDFNIDFENSYIIIGADLNNFVERTILLTLYF